MAKKDEKGTIKKQKKKQEEVRAADSSDEGFFRFDCPVCCEVQHRPFHSWKYIPLCSCTSWLSHEYR